MDPIFKTDLWTVANAAGGKQVEVRLRIWPPSPEAYIGRLKLAGEFLGLVRLNVFYDSSADFYGVGSGRVTIRNAPEQDAKLTFEQFADDDRTSLVDGRDILDRANEMLDTIDDGDDAMNEHLSQEDDENDTYRFGAEKRQQ